jgi:hypothetical protein
VPTCARLRRRKDKPTKKESALAKKAAHDWQLGLTRASIPRKANPSYIAHNKFVVLVEGGEPRAVWTGSMKLTKNGIYGQANVCHVVEDPKVAKAYLDYWDRLAADPDGKSLKPANEAASNIDTGPIRKGTTAVFSPRSGNAQLVRIADLIGKATGAAFITLPFGIVATVAPALTRNDGVLRCILLDSPGNTDAHKASLKKARALPNVIAAGNRRDIGPGPGYKRTQPLEHNVGGPQIPLPTLGRPHRRHRQREFSDRSRATMRTRWSSEVTSES